MRKNNLLVVWFSNKRCLTIDRWIAQAWPVKSHNAMNLLTMRFLPIAQDPRESICLCRDQTWWEWSTSPICQAATSSFISIFPLSALTLHPLLLSWTMFLFFVNSTQSSHQAMVHHCLQSRRCHLPCKSSHSKSQSQWHWGSRQPFFFLQTLILPQNSRFTRGSDGTENDPMAPLTVIGKA